MIEDYNVILYSYLKECEIFKQNDVPIIGRRRNVDFRYDCCEEDFCNNYIPGESKS